MYFKELEESYVDKTMKFIGASDVQVSFGGGNDPRKFFTVGEELIVEHAEVHSWYTTLKFKGHPSIGFNSVCFEFVED